MACYVEDHVQGEPGQGQEPKNGSSLNARKRMEQYGAQSPGYHSVELLLEPCSQRASLQNDRKNLSVFFLSEKRTWVLTPTVTFCLPAIFYTDLS